MNFHIEPKGGLFIRLSAIFLMVANFLFFQNPLLGILSAGLIFSYYGFCIKKSNWLSSLGSNSTLTNAVFLFLTITSIIWVFFYLASTPAWLIFGVTIVLLLLFESVLHINNIDTSWQMPTISRPPIQWFHLSFLILTGSIFFILFHNSTTDAVASPWLSLPTTFFTLFGLLVVNLLIVLKRSTDKANLFFLMLFSFTFVGVVAIFYRLGFGYDPMLHEAGMENILTTATLLPKPFYYIGMYLGFIILNLMTSIPIAVINQFFVPVAFAIVIPRLLFTTFIKNKTRTFSAWLVALAIFIVPSGYFIMTTPQNITNLLALVVIFLTFKPELKRWQLAVALFTCLIHPLYGIPLVLFALYNFFDQKILRQVLLAMSTIIFPILFILNAGLQGHKISFKFDLNWLASSGWVFVQTQNRIILDLIHIYGLNATKLFLLLSMLAVVYLYRNNLLRPFHKFLIFGIIMIANFTIMKTFIELNFVTQSNGADFTERIFDLGTYFFWPTIMSAGYVFGVKLFNQKQARFDKCLLLLLMVTLISASFYFTYPLDNDYINSKLYNVTKADFESVRFIDQNATSDYIVLANQMVAAASIAELGFKQYYGDQFYYSIPNGSEDNIYQYFESMVFDHPTRAQAIAAMNQTDVDQVYFVINDYWTSFTKIVAEAKDSADKWFMVDGGKSYIFYYHK
ncbi:hypothetical protein COT97_03395 [Candidatus Falkowbacteria bacterium CG10_big_fil_rev_8_21_14_0_10_39_11]|uniref:Glycosyltransferase RgtA/B/C/D-like domain-containing protein n=1 Tax=Candidatus Falkowbacteria bacterium CG10_big_fil_rev_8_21_14_0_10_39_11 TaxID=1974565 RepID=A0A2H0V4Q1_9BACT|nr:MAG: hypothetical protein COT97_03395 [Candidatus Falkowbacteria bacterium CG10_big_fil_rev_8_21_14_0_10_39_11]